MVTGKFDQVSQALPYFATLRFPADRCRHPPTGRVANCERYQLLKERHAVSLAVRAICVVVIGAQACSQPECIEEAFGEGVVHQDVRDLLETHERVISVFCRPQGSIRPNAERG